jgi:hypothetical protein
MGWFFGFKLHLVINNEGELMSCCITKAAIDDRKPIPKLVKKLKGRIKGLEIQVPSFGQLTDLFASVSIEIKYYCNKLAKKLASGDKISLIVDSTGLRFNKARHWHETKYGKPCKNIPWRKLHISIDEDKLCLLL